MTILELSPAHILRMQKDQHAHDLRNHFDILSLHKTDRLKHYGLHFCKYVGRLARGRAEVKSISRTTIDTALVCLSAANTLHQQLGAGANALMLKEDTIVLELFADAAGRFADACEKIDHLEDFVNTAKISNQDIFAWLINFAHIHQVDIDKGLAARRRELRQRHFYI